MPAICWRVLLSLRHPSDVQFWSRNCKACLRASSGCRLNAWTRQAPVGTLGLESLMALEFHRRVEHALDLKLAKTLVWRYATIEALSEHLLGRLFPEQSVASEPERPHTSNLVTSALSEDEALAALLGRKEDR